MNAVEERVGVEVVTIGSGEEVELVVTVEAEGALGGPEGGSSWSFDQRRDEISRVTLVPVKSKILRRSLHGGLLEESSEKSNGREG